MMPDELLTEVTISAKDWCVMQYHRPSEQDGMIIAFRRHESSYSGFDCALFEIDPQAKYQIIQSRSYKPSDPLVITGTELRNLNLEIKERPGSLIVEYRKVGS